MAGKHYRPAPVTATSDKNLRIAITGSLLVHGLLFVVLAWMFAGEAAHRLWQRATTPPRDKEVALLFPDQIIPEPEMKVPEPPPPASACEKGNLHPHLPERDGCGRTEERALHLRPQHDRRHHEGPVPRRHGPHANPGRPQTADA